MVDELASPAQDPYRVQACEWLAGHHGVRQATLNRLCGAWTQWKALCDWLPTRSEWTDADVDALALLPGLGLDTDEIRDWLRLGPLVVAVRLTLLSITATQVRQFPLDGKHGSETFLEMMKATKRSGMHVDDLLWWHTGGVLSLDKPYLNQSMWVQWRSVGANHIGMRRAALAAAAGLSPEAAIEAVAEGRDDERAWQMLAGLRAGMHT